MTSRPTLPPDHERWLADHPDLTPEDLAPPWQLAEGADPLDAAPAPDPARIQAIRATLARTATNGPPAEAPRPALRLVKSSGFAYGLAAAACIAVLLAVGLFAWNQPVTVSAPYGGTALIDLPDGSQVQLNSGSSLTYARRFDADARRVHLTGEAFFEVARAGTPFVIETFNANVAVLGTSFNVHAWPGDEAETEVAVVTGIVEVTAKTFPDEAVRLTAGQATTVARVDALPPLPDTADLTVATAWRDGRFVFFNKPLGVMFDEIERRFGIEITAAEPIRSHVQTFRQRVTSAEQLVKDLCGSVTTMSLRYRATANGFEIFEGS